MSGAGQRDSASNVDRHLLSIPAGAEFTAKVTSVWTWILAAARSAFWTRPCRAAATLWLRKCCSSEQSGFRWFRVRIGGPNRLGN